MSEGAERPPRRPPPALSGDAAYERIRARREVRRALERKQRAQFRRRRAIAVLGAAALGAAVLAFLARPGPEPGLTGEVPVPILMYHALGSPPPGNAFPELFVKNSVFEAQMSWLADHGYEGVTLDDVYGTWREDGRLPERPVVISFDDGYRSQYSEAMPFLRERGWPGVLNLKLNTLTEGELTDEQVDEMIRNHWEVDSHTINHLDVSKLEGADLRSEITGSRAKLQKRFRIPVDFFCYPAGRYDKRAVREVKRAGYLGATTTKTGVAIPAQLFALRRIRISLDDGVKGFVLKMRDAEKEGLSADPGA